MQSVDPAARPDQRPGHQGLADATSVDAARTRSSSRRTGAGVVRTRSPTPRHASCRREPPRHRAAGRNARTSTRDFPLTPKEYARVPEAQGHPVVVLPNNQQITGHGRARSRSATDNGAGRTTGRVDSPALANGDRLFAVGTPVRPPCS